MPVRRIRNHVRTLAWTACTLELFWIASVRATEWHREYDGLLDERRSRIARRRFQYRAWCPPRRCVGRFTAS